MTVCADKLARLGAFDIRPIFRKTGPKIRGFKAFTRDEQTEMVMDALGCIADVVRAAEEAGIAEQELYHLRYRLKV